MNQIPVGIQTYSVRDYLSEDYEGTLKKIADIGYHNIEIGGFGPYNSDEWNEVLRKYDLNILSNHIQIEMLEESFNHIAEFNKSIGNHRIVCPYLREERRQDLESYKRVAESLNKIGGKCKEKGFELYYHNHAFEFTDYDGTCGFDILIRETDPELVRFEVDTCWVKFGGKDPADFIRGLKGRCNIIHLKDLEAGDKVVFREVGAGILNFGEIFEAALESGVENFVVEQDVCPKDSLECIADSYKNIEKIWSEIQK